MRRLVSVQRDVRNKEGMIACQLYLIYVIVYEKKITHYYAIASLDCRNNQWNAYKEVAFEIYKIVYYMTKFESFRFVFNTKCRDRCLKMHNTIHITTKCINKLIQAKFLDYLFSIPATELFFLILTLVLLTTTPSLMYYTTLCMFRAPCVVLKLLAADKLPTCHP